MSRTFIVEDCAEEDFGQWAKDKLTGEQGYTMKDNVSVHGATLQKHPTKKEPCKFGESCWRPLCCCGHPRNSARVRRMARLWRFLLADGWRLEPEGEQETLETKVVL